MDAVRLHQSGLTYAVATLGTATTPEHLKRIFRLVSEVVFSFDGDRAGRAAAWRALQNALPEAREGREIRFLFLPEGHDPDTLVAEEGPEAFEKRLESSTVPLSEYLIRELSEQVDLSSADGLARFAEAARPLFAKLPAGVFRELLLGRLARVIGLTPERLQELWSGAGMTPAAAAAGPVTAPTRIRPGAPRSSAGRGSLVRQAIVRLLWFPAIAGQVSESERSGLNACEEPGVELLRELLDNLHASPATSAAQVIERWADKPDGEHLAKLLHREELMADAGAAAHELKAALVKLAAMAAAQRLAALEAKSRTTRLSAEEMQEFQRLMMRKAPPAAS
jgi:DNA primase